MVLGYVTMRVSMIFLWWRAARANAEYRPNLHLLGRLILIAQVGWVLLATVPMSWGLRLPLLVALSALEICGVMHSERRGLGTPWHPPHVAQRYSLLASSPW